MGERQTEDPKASSSVCKNVPESSNLRLEVGCYAHRFPFFPYMDTKHVRFFSHWARLRPLPQRGLYFWARLRLSPQRGLNLWARVRPLPQRGLYLWARHDRYPSVDCTSGRGHDRYSSVDCTSGRGYDRYPSVDCTTGHGYDRYPSVDCTCRRGYDRYSSVDEPLGAVTTGIGGIVVHSRILVDNPSRSCLVAEAFVFFLNFYIGDAGNTPLVVMTLSLGATTVVTPKSADCVHWRCCILASL